MALRPVFHSETLDRIRKLRVMRYESAEACRVACLYLRTSERVSMGCKTINHPNPEIIYTWQELIGLMGILYNYLNAKLQVGLSEMILIKSNTYTSIIIKRSVILYILVFILNRSPYFSINAFWFVTCIWENFQLGMIRETHSQIESDRDNAVFILILAIIIKFECWNWN